MKKIKSFIASSLLLVGALGFYLGTVSINPRSVGAESNNLTNPKSIAKVKRSKSEKISRTLLKHDEALPTNDNGELVQVILQLNAPASGRLNSLLRRNGIRLKDEFRELNSLVVELPFGTVNELSELDEVDFVSLDREVRQLGHVERTTGAALMRTQSGNYLLNTRLWPVSLANSIAV